MKTSRKTLKKWWYDLSPEWHEIFENHLVLGTPLEEKYLEYLFTITELDLSDHKIESLHPLCALRQIEKLYINQTPIKDLTPLACLTNLRELHASFSQVADWRILSGFQSLEILDLSYMTSSPKHLTKALGEMEQLKELYVNKCGITSLKDFVHLPSLEILSLNFNHIPKREVEAYIKSHKNCKVLY